LKTKEIHPEKQKELSKTHSQPLAKYMKFDRTLRQINKARKAGHYPSRFR